MPLHDQDDLMPRPLPKLSQVEIVSVQPEVPEPSLIIDKFSAHPKPNDYILNSYRSSIPNSSPSRPTQNGFSKYYDTYKNKSAEIPTTSSYSSTLHNQVDLHSGCRKVSCSTSSDRDQPKSMNQIHKTFDNCKNSLKTDSCNCQCNSHEMNSDLRNDRKLYSPPMYTDFSRKMHRMSDYECSAPNEVCNRKRCSCSACIKEYFGEVTKEQKQNYISTEELQKTVLKFENLFLKLNYKYSKMAENFVSKEEFSAVTRNYEAKIESMQAAIDTMNSKMKMNHCSYCNQPNSNLKPKEQTRNPVTTKSKESELLCDDKWNRKMISESKSHSNSFDGKYDRKREDFSYEPQVHQTETVESQKCTNIFEDQRRNSLSPSDRFWNARKNGYCEELENRDQLSTRSKERSNPQDHGRLIPAENKSKNLENIYHVELKKDTLVKNLKDDQQLKLLYNNIITQVKSMLDHQNISAGIYGKTDPMQFVKEATVEQFEKLGLNVKNIVDEDKEKHFSRAHSRDNEEAKRISAPKTNVIPSSDVSLHMNALAMKYISNHQKDENDFSEKKSTNNDVSINCNNISIATLKYLERYQISSEPDKPHLDFGTYEIASSTQRFPSIESDQIDRSFIR